MGTRQVLEVDTKRFCLLCLNTNDSQSQNNSTTVKGFKQFLRYLKVNPKDLFNCSSAFLGSMNISEDVDVKIKLCSGCSAQMEKFYKLHQQYEIIRCQFDNCVESVHNSMAQATNDPERVRTYKKEMTPTKSTEFVNMSIAANLRDATFKKCDIKLKSRSPRVTLQNVGNLSAPSSSTSLSLSSSNDLEIHTRSDSQQQQHTVAEQDDVGNHTPKSVIVRNSSVHPSTNVESEQRVSNFDATVSVVTDAETPDVPVSISLICDCCDEKFPTHQLKLDHELDVHYHDIIHQQIPPPGIPKVIFVRSIETTLTFMSINVDEFGYRCSYCNLSERSYGAIRFHVLRQHLQELFEQTVNFVRGEKPEAMDSSDEASVSVPNVATERQQSSPIPSTSSASTTSNFTCDICSRSFSFRAQLNKHRAAHTVLVRNPKAKKNLKCEHCEYSTNLSSAMDYHVLMQHLNHVIVKKLPPGYSKSKCMEVVQQLVGHIENFESHCRMCGISSNNMKSHFLGTHFDAFVRSVVTHLDTDMQRATERGDTESQELLVLTVPLDEEDDEDNNSVEVLDSNSEDYDDEDSDEDNIAEETHSKANDERPASSV